MQCCAPRPPIDEVAKAVGRVDYRMAPGRARCFKAKSNLDGIKKGRE